MLAHRRRRWITIKATLDLRVLNIYPENVLYRKKLSKSTTAFMLMWNNFTFVKEEKNENYTPEVFR